MTLCYHRVGAVGTKFVIRAKAYSETGILEDLDLSGVPDDGYWITFQRPDGSRLTVPGRKDADDNDITYKDATGILTQPGSWSMWVTIRYGAADVVKTGSPVGFEVIA